MSNGNLPIMVHFYCSSYISGAAGVQWLNASHLVEPSNDIIFIKCNYSLKAFGFWLNLGDTDVTAPSNGALLGQKKCLEWIQNNFAVFGSNPLNVTMWWQSAGVSSVGFHMQRQLLGHNQSQLSHQVLFQLCPTGIFNLEH